MARAGRSRSGANPKGAARSNSHTFFFSNHSKKKGQISKPTNESSATAAASIMSYKLGIVQAITELKERSGSSTIALKKFMQAKMPKDKKWMNAMFLTALKTGVASGDFVQNKVRACVCAMCIVVRSFFFCP